MTKLEIEVLTAAINCYEKMNFPLDERVITIAVGVRRQVNGGRSIGSHHVRRALRNLVSYNHLELVQVKDWFGGECEAYKPISDYLVV